MPGGMKVFRGMLILRIIAATDLPANHAYPQINPGIAGTQAFQAAVPAGLDIPDLIPVCAGIGCRPLHSYFWLFGHIYSFLPIIPPRLVVGVKLLDLVYIFSNAYRYRSYK